MYGSVSNAEVLSFLSDLQADRAANPPVVNPGAPPEVNLKDLYAIEDEVVMHLRATPCAEQDEECIKAFMAALRSYDLTKGEKLMLLNLRPKSIAELNPMVEDLDSRMKEETQLALIQLITDMLPYTPPEGEDVDEQQVDGGDPMETA
ncbi:hypothetical protein HDU86_004995 [Geranomyces michiganensis]|nr:hypothetical protein HDU86_004995 [Geranomyces michiganensis]